MENKVEIISNEDLLAVEGGSKMGLGKGRRRVLVCTNPSCNYQEDYCGIEKKCPRCGSEMEIKSIVD